MTPPRTARALLRRALPLDGAGRSVLGDLDEAFRDRAAADGLSAARRWYWRQAISMWWWSAVAHPADSHHHPRGGVMFDALSDLRHAARAAIKGGGQTILVVVTLAVAIGATTIGFTFLDLAVLRGIPVDDPDRVVYLFAVDPRTGNDRAYVTVPDFVDYRRRTQTVERLAAFESSRATLIDRGQPSILDVGRATADFFTAMGQSPHLGRVLFDGDDRPGAPPVVVLSHAYWTNVMGADPGVLGRTLQLGRTAHTIVGVADAELEFGTMAIIDVWIPIVVEHAAPRPGRRIRVIGRLKPEVAMPTAVAEFTAIADSLASEYPETNAGWRARLAPISEATGGRNFWIVISLFVLAVGLVIAVACANVANVLLVKATGRRREMAIRSALGASRPRVVRQLLFEGLLLSIASGALAVPVAEGLLRLIRSVAADPGLQQLRFDLHELGFVAAIVLTGPVVFALAPALSLARTDVRGALAAGGARAGSVNRRSRSALVVVQIALAVILVSTGGLAVRTAVNVSRLGLGITTTDAVKFELELDGDDYPIAARRAAMIGELRDRLASLAGVRGAAAFDRLPIVHGQPTVTLGLPHAPVSPDGARPWALAGETWSGSLQTLGVSLIEGRDFRPEENVGASAVALLSRGAAIRYFGSAAAAIGQRLEVSRADGTTTREIIGVVSDVANADIENGLQPHVWLPLHDARRLGFVVIGDTRSGVLASEIRRTVSAVAPTTAIEQLETYDAAVARQWSSDIIIISVLAGFALLALLLATIGLYAVVAYSAAHRRAEFGTRIALGARSRDVLSLVLGQAFRLLGAGLVLGLAGALATGQAMRNTLVGVGPLDAGNLAMVILLPAFAAFAASVTPAWRASRVDVVQSLRAE